MVPEEIPMAWMVITGNRLHDGAVVWRDPDGNWSRDIADAAIYLTGGQLAKNLDAGRLEEASGLIIGIYEVEVESRDSHVAPARLRERIRAGGPTILFA
ncbi:MAG: DUF2849 domain-containing protein [Alphaproteobacteria bacterium]|nr:DUF2849 domain-containing protein [Alphaproteobacteria bacterium]